MTQVCAIATIALLTSILATSAFPNNLYSHNSRSVASTELHNIMEVAPKMYHLRTLKQLCYKHHAKSISGDLNFVLSRTIPKLDYSCHKGSSGRIAVLGGSEKYTGAPYYAAMAALRTGADLATIFCAEEAANAIKTYSPELMVDSVYKAERMQSAETRRSEVAEMVNRVSESMDRFHCIVIGPGLGRDEAVQDATAIIIKEARKRGISIVLDADALFLLSLSKYHHLIHCLQSPSEDELVDGSTVVLTPNVVEYKRLVNSIADGSEEKLRQILPGVIIVKKGHHDVIERFPTPSKSINKETSEEEKDVLTIDSTVMICEEKGGLKRSGGIGDILAGTIGVFLSWNQIMKNQNLETDAILSCWLASSLTKKATRVAFEKRRRSMTAPDILEEIGAVVDEVASSTIVEVQEDDEV